MRKIFTIMIELHIRKLNNITVVLEEINQVDKELDS